MAEIIVIHSNVISEPFETWLEGVLKVYETTWIAATQCQMSQLSGKKVMIAAQLNEIGYCNSINEMLLRWRQNSEMLDETADVVFVVQSPSQFYTKSYARMLGFQLSQFGFRVVGKPLLELLPGLENLHTWQKVFDESLETIANKLTLDLISRLLKIVPQKTHSKVLVIHASQVSSSNTVALWELVKVHLPKETMTINEIGITRGSVTDCIGCEFSICMKHAEKDDCVVGGDFVKKLMPAIKEADVIVWLCPNYNDAISADLMAVINRMSGVYRYYNLSEKRVYGIVVSGNSGGDSVAMQLIDGLNLNKGFVLPPYFLLSAIASEPLSIINKNGIHEQAKAFALQIEKEI